MSPNRDQYRRKPSAPRVDARHALRLMDVMDTPPKEQASPAAPQPTAQTQSRSVPQHKPIPQVAPSPTPPIEGGYTEITALTHEEGGQAVAVSLTWYAAQGMSQHEQHKEDVRIMWTSCQDLSLRVGEISPACLDAIRRAGQLYSAVLKSMEFLGYGSMSRRRLEQKLLSKGFDKVLATEAVDYMDQRGYLDESDTAMRFAERGVSKLWGPRRIKEDLFARGFPTQVITEVMASLEDVDFVSSCAQLIKRKYGSIPKDPAARRKLAASLMRLGYTSEIISHAMRNVARE